MRKTTWVILALLFISFLVSFIFYDKMPEQMAAHWNSAGQVDGEMGRGIGMFLMPIISLITVLLFFLIPNIDPLKKNIEKFRSYYNGFIIAFISFMLYLHIVMILWNIGYRFEMIQVLAPAFAGLYYYLGILTGKAKRNWFIGIRTPWTLSSDKVWNKVHKIGGKMFKTTGLIALLAILFPGIAIFFVIAPVLIVAIYTFVYSYFLYQKEVKKK